MSEIVVVKFGTSVLTSGSDHLNKARVVDLIRQIAQLYAMGKTVLLVSSGAVLAGWEKMGAFPRKYTIEEKQFLAAVGQSHLMHLYEQIADIYQLKVAQCLLTKDDFTHRKRYLNARSTLFQCFEQGVLPIINENDVVTIDEIKVGDNDNLAAQVACLVNADRLIICTDIAGVYTANPNEDKNAKLIHRIEKITPETYALAGGAGSHRGTGGMLTKIQAAEIATAAGVGVHIVAGDAPDILVKAARNEQIGTFFDPATKKLEAWKRFLLSDIAKTGSITIDEGAKIALLSRGKSLLSVGVTHVEGHFDRGATVKVFTAEQQMVGQGLIRYSSEELSGIKGKQSHEIEPVLGYDFGPVVIHRNDLILS